MICQTPLEISSAFPLPQLSSIGGLNVMVEDELDCAQRKPPRIRLLSEPSASFKEVAAENGTILETSPVLANGRIELLHYLREISISYDSHRYGYLKKSKIHNQSNY